MRDTDRRLLFRQQPGHEPLTFGHPLDFDRYRFHALFDSLEPLVGLRRHHRRSFLLSTAAPAAPPPDEENYGEGTGDEESTAEKSFLEVVAAAALPLLGGRDEAGGRRRVLAAGQGKLCLELKDSLIEETNAFLEPGSARTFGGRPDLLRKLAPP